LPSDASSDFLQNSEDFQQTISNNISQVQSQGSNLYEDFNQDIADSLIFTQLSYSPFSTTPLDPRSQIINSLPVAL
jgi:nicotinamidase-related amidase